MTVAALLELDAQAPVEVEGWHLPPAAVQALEAHGELVEQYTPRDKYAELERRRRRAQIAARRALAQADKDC